MQPAHGSGLGGAERKEGPLSSLKVGPVPDYGTTLLRLVTRGVTGAPQPIHRRINSAMWIRRRNRGPAGEEILEYENPVADIHCPVGKQRDCRAGPQSPSGPGADVGEQAGQGDDGYQQGGNFRQLNPSSVSSVPHSPKGRTGSGPAAKR